MIARHSIELDPSILRPYELPYATLELGPTYCPTNRTVDLTHIAWRYYRTTTFANHPTPHHSGHMGGCLKREERKLCCHISQLKKLFVNSNSLSLIIVYFIKATYILNTFYN